MKEILTASELRFLASQNLGPDDVFDARRWPQAIWFRKIEEANKTVALGSRCKKAGHRLRSRRGHCVQCDTKKLAFAGRFGLEQWVYILGSIDAKLLKIGTCKDLKQRVDKICFERQGGASDWTTLYCIWLPRSGEIEDRAHKRLARYVHYEDYWKDNNLQTARELFRCPFSVAVKALEDVIDDPVQYGPYKERKYAAYEFEPDND